MEKFTAQELFNIFSQTLDGFAFLESIGVAHRDIKTTNIMKAEKDKYKIVDFGEMKQK